MCNFLGARIVMYDPVSTFEAVLRLSVEVQTAGTIGTHMRTFWDGYDLIWLVIETMEVVQSGVKLVMSVWGSQP